MKTKLIIVGGFLGAGKTSFLYELAKKLANKGKAVGLISNDQVPNLVDTSILKCGNFEVKEIAGSCFCCNFNGFFDAAKDLAQKGADFILAEPVGSCTDLSATIINPLKKLGADIFDIAPLSVLMDIERFYDVSQNANIHKDAAYIFLKQLEEADRIFVNKADKLDDKSKSDALSALKKLNFEASFVSAKTGENLDEFLDFVSEKTDTGQKIAEVDYERYAVGEAVLGWLNADVELPENIDCIEGFSKNIFADIKGELQKINASIAHIKALINYKNEAYAVNLLGLNSEIVFRKMENSQNSSLEDKFIFNARVESSPEVLRRIVEDVFAKYKCEIREIFCISPGKPMPTYRYSETLK